jgi:hypothetical protein
MYSHGVSMSSSVEDDIEVTPIFIMHLNQAIAGDVKETSSDLVVQQELCIENG